LGASREGIEAQYGADLASAEPCDQTFEARTRYRAAGGPPEIIVDHLDLPKAAGSRDGGARHWSIAMMLIHTAKLNGVDPMAWLTDVLEPIVSGRTKAHELHALLPWTWAAATHELMGAALAA
jgi:hypothetical protein